MTTLDQIREIEAALARERVAYEVATSQQDEHLANHHLLAIATLIREVDLMDDPCGYCGLFGCACYG